MDDIYEETGVTVPFERIRQFVRGVPRKDGTRKFTTPENESLDAIYKFVTAPELYLLSEEDFESKDISQVAANRLLEYLRLGYENKIMPPSDAISGTFFHTRQVKSGRVVSELIIDNPQENGVVRVNQIERFYDHGSDREIAFRYVHKLGFPKNFKLQGSYSGWGAFTPEDNLFLFLKDNYSGKNRFYFTLSTDVVHSGSGKFETFTLLHHHFPFNSSMEIPDGDDVGVTVRNRVSDNTHEFIRYKREGNSDG